MRIVGILVAAGRGERYGGDKLRVPLPDGVDVGVPIGIAALRRLRAAVPEVIAVVRPDDDQLARLFEFEGVEVIVAERANEGLGASLAAGVAAAGDAGAYVVALADMPWIAPATIAGVAAALAGGASLVAPRCRGERGHPVGFARDYRSELLALAGDEGAKPVLAMHREALRFIDVDDPGVLRDVDTPADLVS